MKRWISLLLVLTMAVGMVACGGGTKEKEPEKEKLVVQEGVPSYEDDKQIELAAYAGPRRAGYRNYNEVLGAHPDDPKEGWEGWITEDGFQDYIDCGFTYLLPEYDAFYDVSKPFKNSALYEYMELAEKMNIPVVVSAEQLVLMTSSDDYRLNDDLKAMLTELVGTLSTYKTWDIDIYHIEKMQKVNAIKAPEMVESGPLKAVIRCEYKYNLSTFTQDMVVYKDSKRIDFRTHANWHETHKLLKVAFYTDIRATKATYDIQFGHVERPTHWNNSWDWAKFEVCGHKWADISETGYGVSLLNDCKYGYSIKDNAMKLSLLRSPKHPDTEADMGEHDFTYALYPHRGTVTVGGTIEEANRLNLPAQIVSGVFGDSRRVVTVSTAAVQIDVVKKAEDEECLIVRMHECRGSRCKVTMQSEYPVKRIVPCNLLEHDQGDAIEGAVAEFVIKPFEIKTFKLYF